MRNKNFHLFIEMIDMNVVLTHVDIKKKRFFLILWQAVSRNQFAKEAIERCIM